MTSTQSAVLPWPGRQWTHSTRQRTFNRRGGRPRGPWEAEPDKVHWVDPSTDYDCLIHRGPLGALCGYVAVPPGHPWYGMDYGECTQRVPCREWCEHSPEALLRVHGGLTYANTCQSKGTESTGVCHVPLEGRPHEVWWFGFDAGHAGDLVPGMTTGFGGALFDGDVYRDLGYIREQCEFLARQLAGVAH